MQVSCGPNYIPTTTTTTTTPPPTTDDEQGGDDLDMDLFNGDLESMFDFGEEFEEAEDSEKGDDKDDDEFLDMYNVVEEGEEGFVAGEEASNPTESSSVEINPLSEYIVLSMSPYVLVI